RVHAQVGLPRGSRTKPYGDVGLADVWRGAVGVRVDGDRLHAQRVRAPDDAAGDLSPVRDQDDVVRGHGRTTTMRRGVGLKALQGLFIWGQFDTRTRTSVSACTATRLPGADIPSTMPSDPSASTGTFMNQLRLETRSRAPSPCFAASVRKFSRQP